MVLTIKESGALLNVLSEENVDTHSLDSIFSQLSQQFKKEDYFKVGCSIVMLLQHSDLLPKPSQRLAAASLLCDLYKGDPSEMNPFLPVLIQLLRMPDSSDKNAPRRLCNQLPSLSVLERSVLSQLMSGNSPWGKKTPKQILMTSDLNAVHPVDITGMELGLAEKLAERSYLNKCGIPVAVAMPDWSAAVTDGTQPTPAAVRASADALLSHSATTHCVRPELIRLVPPLHPSRHEYVWMDVTDWSLHRPLYDQTLCAGNNSGAAARRLMTRAFAGPLTLQQQQHLLTEIEQDPKLVYMIGLTPAKLPDLVENNPLIAIDMLLRLMESSQITEYFSVLVNMEMSLHSMEVVNRLTTTVDLPTEFVHLYITNCISTCENIKDRYMQNRLVRLLCVFLQSLIRNKIINVQELFIELQAFCIDFSRIREAAALFRLLKQLEADDAPGGSATNTSAASTPSSTTPSKTKPSPTS